MIRFMTKFCRCLICLLMVFLNNFPISLYRDVNRVVGEFTHYPYFKIFKAGLMYSKIKIFGHPIHPILVAFPIAFYTGALAAFIAYNVNGDAFWFKVGYVA